MAEGHRVRLRGVAVALAGLVVACSGTPAPPHGSPTPYVLRLDARGGGSFEGRGQAAWVADVVGQGLAHARWLRADGPGPELDARLRFEERRDAAGAPILEVQLVLLPDPALASELADAGLELEATVELERRDQTLELPRDLPVAFERAVALVDAKLTCLRGEPAEVEALLGDDDPEVVLLALDGVERRQLRALADPVLALTAHEEDRVALRAIECLGAVGRPEQAQALVRAARLADRAHANRLYDTLANLGGEDAHGFLAFAARNEDDPELAALAEQALLRLEASPPSSPADAVARGHRQ